MHKLAPEYLLLFTQSHAEYNLRNLEGKLALPKSHTNYLNCEVFVIAGPVNVSAKFLHGSLQLWSDASVLKKVKFTFK